MKPDNERFNVLGHSFFKCGVRKSYSYIAIQPLRRAMSYSHVEFFETRSCAGVDSAFGGRCARFPFTLRMHFID